MYSFENYIKRLEDRFIMYEDLIDTFNDLYEDENIYEDETEEEEVKEKEDEEQSQEQETDITENDNNNNTVEQITEKLKTLAVIDKIQDFYHDLLLAKKYLLSVYDDKLKILNDFNKFEMILIIQLRKLNTNNYQEIESLVDTLKQTVEDYIKQLAEKTVNHDK